MHQDFKDLLAALGEHDAEFIIVGAHALVAHGYVRATRDLDVWVRPSHQNATRVLRALAVFGAPLLDLTKEDLATPGTIF